MSNPLRCPVCSRAYTLAGDALMTRDHIMPVVWGGSASFYGIGIVDRVTRRMCHRCNSYRGAVGHCIGALACVLAVAGDECIKPSIIIRRWRFFALPSIGRKSMRAWIRKAGLAPPIP
jgi:hypothetical protein